MKARYIMIGGFLGAGKTTAILKLAEYLSAKGQRVGLITNDQSVGLVDTEMLAAHGFPVSEITGGCFCCKFNSLVEAAKNLAGVARPEFFIAEPVGSCTDLKASVSYPLRRMYGNDYSVAPLSVLIDPLRALRILGLEPGKAFSKKVVYVYEKQLEEAELIVINKIDRLDEGRRKMLRDALASRFPKARIFEVSARDGTGLEEWFSAILDSDLDSGPTMDVDYDLYAEGEALLGWLNATIDVSSTVAIDGNALLERLAQTVVRRLQSTDAQIAHLKMTLTPGDGASDLAVLNVVANEQAGELSHTLAADIEVGELILNLRAEADPEMLKTQTQEALAEIAGAMPGLSLDVAHLEHFRPGRPQPTHRYADALGEGR